MDLVVVEGDFPFWRGFLVEEWKRVPVRTLCLSQAPGMWRPGDYDRIERLPLSAGRVDAGELRRLVAAFGGADGALTVFEPAVGRTLEVQRALGLPELSSQLDGRALRNKATMVEIARRAGLAVPRTVSGGDAGLLADAALATLPFPVVVKPSELAGKAGVRLARDEEELRAAVRAALEETLPFEIDGVPASVVGTFGCEQSALVQEYVEGPEFSVEGYAAAGRTVVLELTEKHTSGPPLFEELGHLQPAAVDAGERKALVEYAAAASEAFGLQNAFFHLELRLAARGPVLMEINCRLGGDLIARLLELRSGMNVGAVLARIAAGQWVEPPARWVGAAGVRMAAVRSGGRIRTLRPPLLRGDRELAAFELAPGDVVHAPKPGGVARLGYYLVAADTRGAVERRLAELAAETRVEMETAAP